MRIATIVRESSEEGVLYHQGRYIPLRELFASLGWEEKPCLEGLLKDQKFEQLRLWYSAEGEAFFKTYGGPSFDPEKVRFAPLYRNPSKIWGIGLNYVDHAADLAEVAPSTEPASFMKTNNTIIGSGDEIQIPLQSSGTTGEAELGIVFGSRGWDVSRENWLSCVAGFTTIIDMTAEDILRKNPRYLTRSKCFDTFLSFGPELVTPDEVPHVTRLRVATVINGKVHAENTISHMTFPPDYLVSFHSKVFPWEPGDILSTGTPRAAHLSHGDVVACHIDGFRSLENPVVDKKR